MEDRNDRNHDRLKHPTCSSRAAAKRGSPWGVWLSFFILIVEPAAPSPPGTYDILPLSGGGKASPRRPMIDRYKESRLTPVARCFPGVVK